MMVPRAGIVAILTELNPLPLALPSCPPTPTPPNLSRRYRLYDGALGHGYSYWAEPSNTHSPLLSP